MSDAWVAAPVSEEDRAAWVLYWENYRSPRELTEIGQQRIRMAYAADAFRWAWKIAKESNA